MRPNEFYEAFETLAMIALSGVAILQQIIHTCLIDTYRDIQASCSVFIKSEASICQIPGSEDQLLNECQAQLFVVCLFPFCVSLHSDIKESEHLIRCT